MDAKHKGGPEYGSPVIYVGERKEAHDGVVDYGMSGTVVGFYNCYYIVKFYTDFDYPCILSDLEYENT